MKENGKNAEDAWEDHSKYLLGFDGGNELGWLVVWPEGVKGGPVDRAKHQTACVVSAERAFLPADFFDAHKGALSAKSQVTLFVDGLMLDGVVDYAYADDHMIRLYTLEPAVMKYTRPMGGTGERSPQTIFRPHVLLPFYLWVAMQPDKENYYVSETRWALAAGDGGHYCAQEADAPTSDNSIYPFGTTEAQLAEAYLNGPCDSTKTRQAVEYLIELHRWMTTYEYDRPYQEFEDWRARNPTPW